MSITLQEARDLVALHLAADLAARDADLVILDEDTIHAEFGWIFFWNSKKYRETGEIRHALAGNAPLIVDKYDGSIHETSTSHPIEEIIENYRYSRVAAV